MYDADAEARVFLEEFEGQPQEVRQVFLYAICQTMVQAGTLHFVGASTSPGIGVTLLYRNPDTGEILEIIKPKMTEDEEQAMRLHIGELLQENARAA